MFDAKLYWDQRYADGKTSGSGSYGEPADKKINDILKLVGDNKIDSILDIGCGDFNVGNIINKALKPKTYIGLDISDEVLKMNKSKYPDVKFEEIDYSKTGKYDLVLCLDVLYHAIDDYDKLCDFIKRQDSKYFAIQQLIEDKKKVDYIVKKEFNYKEFLQGYTVEKKVSKGENTYLYLYKKI